MRGRLLEPFREQGQSGYVLLLALVTSVALFIALSGILSLSLANLSSAKRTMFDTAALYAAEAGVDNAVYQLNATAGTYTGTNTSCPVTSTGSNPVDAWTYDSTKGKGTYETCILPGSIDKEFLVYVVGKVYKTNTATNPIATRRLRVTVKGSPAGSYAVQTGPGGLIMRNSANISQGPVYIGGYLWMYNSATIGAPGLPIAVDVANARCPTGGGATYPVVCNTGTSPNPIVLNGVQNHIYGTVNANDQTNAYTTQITDSGLAATSGVTAPTLPSYDRVAQAAAVSSTITGAAASCSGSETVTWPANVKIVGDVTLKNSCVVTVSGNAWITGSFNMRNSSIIKVGSGVTSQPTIMVDGASGVVTTQTATVATNASQVGMEFITFYSANTACSLSTSSNCNITGQNLFDSKDIVTVDIGNQGAASGSVFYARWSKVTLGQAGAIGALLGQTIDLGQSGNLVFTTTVVTGNYSYDVTFYEFGNW